MKWGVGKLIAHSPKKAIVIPFIQFGMETLMPQHPITKKLDSHVPIPGHNVLVILGEEMNFDDLIKEHEDMYGVLWKYKASVDDENSNCCDYDNNHDVNNSNNNNNDNNNSSNDNNSDKDDFHRYWDSKPEELKLYHKITLRIEKALALLNKNKELL